MHKYPKVEIEKHLDFLIDDIFVLVVGLPMDKNCGPICVII
jgi:hypothetical protein